MLRLDTEEEARSEVVDEVYTGSPIVLVIRRVFRQEIAVDEGNQPPEDGEDQPREQEAC